MPQLNVAPSPSPVVPAAAPASGAPAAAASSAAPAADGAAPAAAPAQPFAAVLKQQVKQQGAANQAKEGTDKAANMASAAMAALQAQSQAQQAEQPATDALAAIAQMLTGITPPAAGAALEQPGLGQANGKGKKSAQEDESDPLVLATPNLPATPAPIVAAPPSEETAAAKSLPDPTAALPRAENLAADGAQEAASRAAPAKDEAQDFASLLPAGREASAAANAAAPAAHAATNASTASVHVQTPVGARGWDNEVGDKLTWMVNKRETSASLVLNPPQMGRIEVSISLNGDQASASFVSANPNVRDALENAVPRLREILQDAGITLGQAQVGAESFQQQAGNRENGDNSSRSAHMAASAAIGDDSLQAGGLSGGGAAILRRGNGLVDTFA